MLGTVITPLYMTLLSPYLGTVRSLGLNLQENLSTIYRKNTDELQRSTKEIGVWSSWPVRSSRGNWGGSAGKEVA